MKRILSFILLFGSLLTLTACSDAADSSKVPDKTGLEPYALSEKEQDLLAAFGIQDKAQILSFRAPEETTSLHINVYQLSGGGNEWENIGGGDVSLDTTGMESPEQQSGTFTMQLRKDRSIDFDIDYIGHFSFETEPFTFDQEVIGSTWSFLDSFQNIEPDTEIPVAVIVYDSGNHMPSCTPQDYFDPSNFEGMDLVQAVTLEFE